MEDPNQIIQSKEIDGSESVTSVVDTTTPRYKPEKKFPFVDSGLQNEMLQELLEFPENVKVLSKRHKEFIGLCDRLAKLGRKQSMYRLKRLFYIDPVENEFESDKDLELDSMEDYVTFLENTEIKIEPLMGMSNDGKIHTNWNVDNKPYFSVDFLGNRKTYCIIKNNDDFLELNLKVNELIKKLSELNVI